MSKVAGILRGSRWACAARVLLALPVREGSSVHVAHPPHCGDCLQVAVAQPALTVAQQVLPPMPAASQALSGDVAKPLASVEGAAAQAEPAVKQEAAQVLQDHAQHLAVQASGRPPRLCSVVGQWAPASPLFTTRWQGRGHLCGGAGGLGNGCSHGLRQPLREKARPMFIMPRWRSCSGAAAGHAARAGQEPGGEPGAAAGAAGQPARPGLRPGGCAGGAAEEDAGWWVHHLMCLCPGWCACSHAPQRRWCVQALPCWLLVWR